MFTHVALGSNNLEQAEKFHKATFATLGYGKFMPMENRFVFVHEGIVLLITQPINGKPATVANGLTVGLSAPSVEAVDAWYKAGLENGGEKCELTQPPYWKDSPRGKIYIAYLKDPDGNKLCVGYRAD